MQAIAVPAAPFGYASAAVVYSAQGATGAVGVTPATSAAPAGGGAATDTANPSLALDPSLGLVVIQFHDASGAVVSSIPSASQLAAYSAWRQTGQGPDPLGANPGAAAAGSAPVDQAA
jgi:hypothetical protein